MNMRLYTLGYPSICISITASVISPFIGQSQLWIISILNAVLTVFITLIFVLKLETTAANYEIVASRYIRLQEDLDAFTSKLAFVGSKHEKEKQIFSKMKKLESKIAEIKEDAPLELPHYIRYLYPKISKINIFSSMYSVELHRKNLINSLKSVINETRCIRAKWEAEFACKKRDPEYTISGFYRLKETNRINTLADKKDHLKGEIAKYKNTYSFIDGVFQQEINDKKNKELWWLYNICFCTNLDIGDKVLKYD
jgi:low affinity Fe/Cu permease